jgi:hypothetical protein
VTKLGGAVELVGAGALPNHGERRRLHEGDAGSSRQGRELVGILSRKYHRRNAGTKALERHE